MFNQSKIKEAVRLKRWDRVPCFEPTDSKQHKTEIKIMGKKLNTNTQFYDIRIKRLEDDSLFEASKVSYDWLLRFLKGQSFKDAKNIEDGNEILGKKSFGKNRTSTQNKIQQNK